jgi:hypothetical protein
MQFHSLLFDVVLQLELVVSMKFDYFKKKLNKNFTSLAFCFSLTASGSLVFDRL